MSKLERIVPLSELVEVSRQLVDPSSLGEVPVQHFSLPAFDERREPERVAASQVHSTKLAVQGRALLVSRLNPHIPRVWLAEPAPSSPALTSTEMLVLTARPGVSLDYLHAALSTRQFTSALCSLVGGTSTSHQRVRARDALDIPVPVMLERVQEEIGDVATLLHRRRLQVRRLERAILDYLEALGREIGEEAGGRATQLGDLASVTKGVSYASSELAGDKGALVTLKSFGRDGGYRSDGLKPWWGRYSEPQRLAPGDLVVAQTDLTQAADVLGRAVLVRPPLLPRVLVASLDVAIVRPHQPLDRPLIFSAMLGRAFRAHCRGHANGTTVLHLRSGAIEAAVLVAPSTSQRQRLATLAEPVIQRWMELDAECHGIDRAWGSLVDEEIGAHWPAAAGERAAARAS